MNKPKKHQVRLRPVRWDECRDQYDNINLHEAYRQATGQSRGAIPTAPRHYLDDIQALQPIRSRQVAAKVIVDAARLRRR